VGVGSLKWTKNEQVFSKFGIQLMIFTIKIGLLKQTMLAF